MNEAKQLMNLSPSDLFYYALIGNCSNDFITKCYNDMEEKDKITLLRNIDTCETTIKNSNSYQYNSSLYISESTFNLSNDYNYNQLFEILVKTNNYQILSDLLHLFKRNNINVLLPTFYCSMKISDYKCFMYLINEDLFYRLEPNDKNKIINILPINEFYIWLKDNKTFCDDLSDKVKIRIEAFITTYDIFYKGLSFFNKDISYNETKTIINQFLIYIFMYDNDDSVNNLLAPFLKFKNKRLFTSIVFFLFTKLNIPFNSQDILSIFKRPLFIDEDYAIILIYIYEEINHIDFLKLKRFSYVNNYIKENVLPDIWNVNEIKLHSQIENNNNEENEANSLVDLFSEDLETNPFSFWKSLNTLMIIEKNSFKLKEEIIENIKTNNYALTRVLLSEKMNILNLFTKIPPSNKSILDIKKENENTKIPFINSLNDINWLPQEENRITKLVQVLKELEFIYSEFSFLWKTNPILNEYFLCFKNQEFEMLFNYLNDELIEGIKNILPEIVYIVFGKETSSSTQQTISFTNQSEEARRNILQQFQELFTSNTSTDENPIKKYKNNLTFIINSFLAYKNTYLRTEFSFVISERFKFIFEYEENPDKAKSMITKSFCLICHFYFQDQENSDESETKYSLSFPFAFHNNNVPCPIEPSTKTPIENILQQIPSILIKFSSRSIKRNGYYVYKQLIIKFCEYHLNLGENDNKIYLPNNNEKDKDKSESVDNDIHCNLNEVEFIELIKYLYFSKNVNPLLSSQEDDIYYTTQFIEKFCDFNSVKTSKYFLTYMLKDVLSIVNECTHPFRSIFDPKYLIRNVNISEDIIVPVYNGNEKKIPNLMKYIYCPFIEYQKNIMKYIPEYVNLQLEILEVKNIIEKYVMNKKIIFKTNFLLFNICISVKSS